MVWQNWKEWGYHIYFQNIQQSFIYQGDKRWIGAPNLSICLSIYLSISLFKLETDTSLVRPLKKGAFFLVVVDLAMTQDLVSWAWADFSLAVFLAGPLCSAHTVHCLETKSGQRTGEHSELVLGRWVAVHLCQRWEQGAHLLTLPRVSELKSSFLGFWI